MWIKLAWFGCSHLFHHAIHHATHHPFHAASHPSPVGARHHHPRSADVGGRGLGPEGRTVEAVRLGGGEAALAPQRGAVQQACELCARVDAEGDGSLDGAGRVFEVPVAAQFGVAGIVVAGRHVTIAQRTQRLDERFALFVRGQIAAVNQQVGTVAAPAPIACRLRASAVSVIDINDWELLKQIPTLIYFI